MAPFNRFFMYFANNRNIALGAMSTAAMGFFGINFIPHNICIKQYREFFQAYKNGEPRQITPKTQEIFNKAIEIVDIEERYKKFIKHFVAYGFDVVSIGSTSFRQGVFIGIPTNYSYESAGDIDKNEIVVRNKQIDWSSEQGMLLEEALVLTDDEKLFGILRAILEADSQKTLLNSVYPFVSILVIYTLGNRLNTQMNLLKRPFPFRGILYTILGFFGYGLWSFLKDFTAVQYEAAIDKKMCEMGEKFVETGVRFYNKLLQKNIAVRELTGDSRYTAKGNLNFMIRQKSLPLTIRKSFFEQKLNHNEKIVQ